MKMRSYIEREISSLKESIIFCIDFYLRCFCKEDHNYTEDDDELLNFGITTLKDIKQLANGQQRFLKGLLKLQPKKKKRRTENQCVNH